MRAVWQVNTKYWPMLLASILVAASAIWDSTADAACPVNPQTNNTGTFLAKNPAGLQNSTSPADVAANEALLASLSGRPAGSVHFVERIEGISAGTCKQGTSVDVSANTPAQTGFWQSSLNICFVVVKAGAPQSGGGAAVYQYPGAGVTSGSWTTAQLNNHDISHIDFYRCDTTTTGQTGTILVIKNSSGGDDTFTFNSNIPTGSPSFTIQTSGGTGTRTFNNLTPGTYSLSEVVPAGWSFNSLQCTGGGGNTSTGGVNATIGLDAGETVICTYSNTKTPTTGQQVGSIIVKKVAIGGNASFPFAVSGPANQSFQLMGGGQQTLVNLPVGQYTVGESSIPQSWSLQSASCGQGTKQGNSIVVDLDPNETITCTFTNFKEKDEQMEQVTKSFVHRRVDNLLTNAPDRSRILNRLQEQDPQPSLKDGPLKLSGEPGLGQRSGFLGNDRPSLGPTGLTQRGWGEPEFGLSEWERHQREEAGGVAAFGALGASTNLVNDFRFSASLNDLRAKAQAAEEQNAQRKLEEGGLGYYASPYAPPRNSLRQGLDVWTEGHLSFYEDGTGGIARDGRFSIVYIGADYPLSTKVLFGVLAQFDWTKEKLKDPVLSGDVGGNGWMAGPYIGIRLTPNLVFDARVAWGTSQNDITLTDPLAGTRTGSFDTTRWLATATLSGNHNYGPWRFSPQAGLAYGAESYDTFHNSLGQIVSGSDIAIGRFTLGSEVGYRIVLHDGSLAEPYVGVTGIWNFHSDDLVISGVLVTPNRTRAKVEGGILLRSPSGPSMRAAVSYDGVGDSDFTAVTGRVWVGVPFN